jgi:hypothetical protein
MRKHRIVLYNPRAPFFTMPLGLIAIGSALDRSRYDVIVIDGRIESDPVARVLEATDGALCLGVGVLTGLPIADALAVTEAVQAGRPAWDAVVEATEHRMRPIMLTAAAASLGLVPIAREIFWGPMAYAMIGGIIVGTVLTLVFLPALYVAWFRIKEPVAPEQPASSETVMASPDLMPSELTLSELK